MRDYKVKTKVIDNFSVQNGNELRLYEIGEEIEIERSRYEYLLSKCKVAEGQEVEEKKHVFKD